MIDDRAAVSALLDDLDAAASAQDVDRFLSYFVDGPEFAFSFNGTVRVSRAELRAFHVAAWANVARISFRTAIERIAFPAEGVAVVTGLGRSQRTLNNGEERAGDYALSLRGGQGIGGLACVAGPRIDIGPMISPLARGCRERPGPAAGADARGCARPRKLPARRGFGGQCRIERHPLRTARAPAGPAAHAGAALRRIP